MTRSSNMEPSSTKARSHPMAPWAVWLDRHCRTRLLRMLLSACLARYRLWVLSTALARSYNCVAINLHGSLSVVGSINGAGSLADDGPLPCGGSLQETGPLTSHGSLHGGGALKGHWLASITWCQSRCHGSLLMTGALLLHG